MNGIESILADLQRQRAAIDNALEALRGIGAEPLAKKRGRPKGATTKAARKYGVSSEGRQRQIEAIKAYWAAKRAGKK